MAIIGTTLAWGVPIDVEVLGAHLEAYFSTLSVVSTLKLCYYFGKGEHVPFNRLPPELMLCIVDHIVLGERVRQLPRWKQDYQCYQLLCDPIDHLVKPESHHSDEMQSKANGLALDNAHGKEVVPDTWARMSPEWKDVHVIRRKCWERRTHPLSAESPFTKYKDLIQKHFGLEIWNDIISVHSFAPHGWWARELPGYSYSHSTVAWLLSPFPESFEMKEGFPLSAPSCSSLTRAKFDRALAILGLQPCLHKSQQGLLIDEDRTEWPKPTALTRSWQGEQGRNDRYQCFMFKPARLAKLVTGPIWNTM